MDPTGYHQDAEAKEDGVHARRQFYPRRGRYEPAEFSRILRDHLLAHYEVELHFGSHRGFMTPAAQDGSAKDPDPLLFISHTSSDKAIGSALKALFESSLPLEPRQIRFTSSPDSALRPGWRRSSAGERRAAWNHGEQLGRECTTVPAFVALISERFLISPYPMFELGARWGSGKDLIAVQLRGLPKKRLPDPIAGATPVDASNDKSLIRMLEALYEDLRPHLPEHHRAITISPDLEMVHKVARLNGSWHRIRPPSGGTAAKVLALLSLLFAAVALCFWYERESFRPPALACRDGLERLTRIRGKLGETQAELLHAIRTDTEGCIPFLSTAAGDEP